MDVYSYLRWSVGLFVATVLLAPVNDVVDGLALGDLSSTVSLGVFLVVFGGLFALAVAFPVYGGFDGKTIEISVSPTLGFATGFLAYDALGGSLFGYAEAPDLQFFLLTGAVFILAFGVGVVAYFAGTLLRTVYGTVAS